MSRIYCATNRIKFTDIPEKYSIPRTYRSKQMEVHSAVITYVFENFKDTKKYKQKVVDALNCLTYCIIQNDPPPFNWVSTNPLDTMPEMDMDLVESTLGDLYLTLEAIDWDVTPSDNALVEVEANNVVSEVKAKEKDIKDIGVKVEAKQVSPVVNKPLQQLKESQKKEKKVSSDLLTPKEDLYIQPPKCPRFDVNKIWMSANVGGDSLVIYTTLPEIPTKQNEISVTTNLDMMTDSELLALYPNHVIHTRSPKMYEKYPGLEYDEDLGVIIPINGFTREQLIDNLIRYPHLYRLRKVGPDGSITKFFSTIELNGTILPIETAWDSLPESKIIPRDSEFVKEYVVRRYLLEEENGIRHQYNIVGSLDPFLTLFMPYANYVDRGYKDIVSIVKQCVTSRIHYKQSRSPILKRMEQSV